MVAGFCPVITRSTETEPVAGPVPAVVVVLPPAEEVVVGLVSAAFDDPLDEQPAITTAIASIPAPIANAVRLLPCPTTPPLRWLPARTDYCRAAWAASPFANLVMMRRKNAATSG